MNETKFQTEAAPESNLPSKAEAILPAAFVFSKDLKQILAPKATDLQWRMYKGFVDSYGLNPFLKEVFFSEEAGIIVSRDGYLRIAQRHPNYGGLEVETIYVDAADPKARRQYRFTSSGVLTAANGAWVAADSVPSPLKPLYSIARVKGKDGTGDVEFKARFDEYNRPTSTAWQKYPSPMLEKCASSRALKHFCGVSGAVGAEEIGGED